MSQSHLVLDFPIDLRPTPRRSPKSCRLMPTSRTRTISGPCISPASCSWEIEKLLFLSDIDGDGDQHIERLVDARRPRVRRHLRTRGQPAGHAGRKQPPAGPQMAEASCPRASGHVLRLRGRVGPGHQGIARARRTSRAIPRSSPLLTYMAIKSRLQGFALKLAARSIRDDGL